MNAQAESASIGCTRGERLGGTSQLGSAHQYIIGIDVPRLMPALRSLCDRSIESQPAGDRQFESEPAEHPETLRNPPTPPPTSIRQI
jgi:hypothetical protein